MSRTLGALLALILWSALVFVAARETVPDRSSEVRAWRDRAQAVLDSAWAAADSLAAAAAAHQAAAQARADSADQRARAALQQSAGRQERVTALEGELASVATLVDTARVQAVMIAALREDAADLRSGLAHAQEAIRALRVDLQVADDDRRQAVAELVRVQALLREGVAVTRPSRGGVLSRMNCAAGPTATRHGFDAIGLTCGVAIR